MSLKEYLNLIIGACEENNAEVISRIKAYAQRALKSVYIQDQILLNMDTLPEDEARFQAGYSRGHEVGYERGKGEQPGLPPLPEPILTDKGVKDWEGEKDEQYVKATDTVTITMTNMNHPLANKGATWVRASERLPVKEGIYKVKRFYSDEEEKAEYKGGVFTNYQGYVVCEWYDESGTAAGREEDAVAFAEWAGWDWRRVEGKSLWENQKTLEVIKSDKLYAMFKKETGR